MRVKDAVGRYGETVAADHLRQAGYLVVDTNWRCRDGELDIVARERDTLVFVEVKTRSSTTFGLPGEAVNRVKITRIRKLALRWLAEHRDTCGGHSEIRFDVVSVLRRRDGPPEVTHLVAAF